MELLALLLIVWIGVPFPLALYLWRKSRKDRQRIKVLEEQIQHLGKQQFQSGSEDTRPPVSAPGDSEKEKPLETTPEEVKESTEKPPRSVAEEPGEVPDPRTRKEPSASIGERKASPASKPEETPPTAEQNEPESPGVFERLVAFLRSMGMLPPANASKGEYGLISWYAPRLGGLLLVLTLVFFAVYIADRASPTLRFIQMLVFSLAVAGVGWWRRNKAPALGKALLATGLSMVYLTMVAGYVAPPVRVFSSPLIGLLAQVGTLTVLMAYAFREKATSLYVLFLIYSYASSMFSASEGLREGALFLALGLGIITAFFCRRNQAIFPQFVAVAGSSLPVLAFAGKAFLFGSVALPFQESILVYLALAVSLLPLQQLLRWLDTGSHPKAVGWLHGFNTSVMLAAGYLFFELTQPQFLPVFYGYGASLFILWSLPFFSQRKDGLFSLFFIKGALLAALFGVKVLHGDIRWLALAMQSVAVVGVAWKRPSRWTELLVWVLVAWAFILMVDQWRVPEEWGFLYVAYLLAPVLVCFSMSFLQSFFDQGKLRTFFYGAAGILCFATVFPVVMDGPVSRDLRSFALCLAAASFALIYLPLRRIPSLSFTASVFSLVGGVLLYWFYPYGWLSFLTLLGFSALLLWQIRRSRGIRFPRVREILVHATWQITVGVFLTGYHHWDAILLLSWILAILVLALGRRFYGLGATSWIIPAVNLIALSRPDNPLAGLIFLSVGAFAYATAPMLRPSWPRHFKPLHRKTFWIIPGHALIGMTLFLYLGYLSQLQVGWTLAAYLLFTAALAFLFRRVLSIILMTLMAGFLLFFCRVTSQWDPLEYQHTTFLMMGLSSLVLISAINLLLSLRKKFLRLHPSGHHFLLFLFTSLGFLTLASLVFYPPFGVTSLITPILAVYPLLMLVAGLLLKEKALRLTCLAWLAFPILRLFIVDIDDVLHRILAFFVLAVVLILTGALYGKFNRSPASTAK